LKRYVFSADKYKVGFAVIQSLTNF